MVAPYSRHETGVCSGEFGMKRAEYETQLNNLQNPYLRWITEQEEKRYETDPETQEEAEKSVPSGASDQMACFREKYEVFLLSGAEIADKAELMIKRALKNCSEDSLPDIIYGDEDILDQNGRHDPWFKPDWSPDTLESMYYFGSLTLVRREIAEKVMEEKGVLTYGSTDFLKACAFMAKTRLHISEILSHGDGTDHTGYAEKIFETSHEKADSMNISVTAVILSKDHPELLEKCVSSLRRSAELEGTDLSIVVVDNGSNDANTQRCRQLSEKYGFEYDRYESPFIYSALCNRGAENARKTDFILFLNDDVEVPENTVFLRRMAKKASEEHVGAVGCKLLYPGEERIQHCGITLLRTGASHKLAGYTDDQDYYHGINRGIHNCFAVTGACLMVSREKFELVSGFDEKLAIAYTDVDLCASFLRKGLFNVCMCDFYLIHHESLSRRSDDISEEAFSRLASERTYFEEKNASLIQNGDPWYSPNLTDTGLDYRVNVPDTEEEASVMGRDHSSSVTPEDFNKLKPGHKKMRYSLENIRFCRSDACGREKYYEIRGWAFVSGRPGYEYDPFIAVKTVDGEKVFPAVRYVRKDVPNVFASETGLSLSGFFLMIDEELLPDGDKTEIQIGLLRRGLFSKYRGCRTGWITAQA